MSRGTGLVITLLLGGILLAAPSTAQEEDVSGWPQQIDVPEGTVIVYEPQPESWEGNTVAARAAISVELAESGTPIFGVVWFDARLETDRDARTVTIEDLSVTGMRFPVENEGKGAGLRRLLETEIPKWELRISLDGLLASLELADHRDEGASRLGTSPPKILFLPEPAVLISLDGEPRLAQEAGTDLMRVVNTPFSILFVPSSDIYYLNADSKAWYQSTSVTGSYSVAESVPAAVLARTPETEPIDEEVAREPEAGAEEEAAEESNEDALEPGPAPRVVVVTEPTELISSTGEPEYAHVEDTNLLYMSNTDSDVILDITDQRHYVLLAGRWYATSALEAGPWAYVAGEDLPSDFARIPEDSQMGTVLYAVPGTDLAREAVMDTQVPQTATIDRSQANLDVEYDGDPEFAEITQTTLGYAVNTATPVIRVDGEYYACDQAVWFVAASAVGPWKVATSVPGVIYTIPPESPVYYVTYVRVYDYTPEVVFVGYTPGYTGTYVYHTTIVYGTGFYYPGWYRRYYYPRYTTWGFHVRYNPWRGWSFGYSYASGPYRFTIGRGGWYRGGWWGPGRYRGYRHGYHRGYRHGARAGYRAGYHSGSRSRARDNMYRSPANAQRTVAKQQVVKQRRQGSAAPNRRNDVFADKSGNVHRKTEQGWQQHTDRGWQDEPSRRPETRAAPEPDMRPERPGQQPSAGRAERSRTQQLDRSYDARQRGSQRTRSYNQSRGHSRGGAGRGGGGRGGGGRR